MVAQLLLCLIVAFPGDPPSIAIASHVDLVEINHYHDLQGRPVFDQLIYYDWDNDARRYNVCAWRLLKEDNQIPVRNPATGKYTATWHDGKTLRIVHADRRVETWTQHDPENHERVHRAKSQRADFPRPIEEPR
jgi:hypothetical protein